MLSETTEFSVGNKLSAAVKMATGPLPVNRRLITLLGVIFDRDFIPMGLLTEKKMIQRVEQVRVYIH
jgi:hypothetical protein